MMESKVPSVSLVQLVLRVPPERTVTREKSADLDRREAKETRVNLVHLVQVVFRVWWERPAQLAATVSLDREDNRVCLARKETKDPEDSQVYQDPSGCRVCPALLVRRERMETWDQWGELVLLVPEVLRVPADPQELKALLVVSAHPELLEKRERRENLATPAPPESTVSEAVKERLERKERPDPPEPLDPPEDEDLPETTAPKETLAQLDSLETPVPLESPALLVLTVWVATKEMMEKLVSLVLLVHLEKLEYRDLLANGDPQEKPVRRADKERREPRERPEQKAWSGKLDPWDLRDHLEKPVPRV